MDPQHDLTVFDAIVHHNDGTATYRQYIVVGHHAYYTDEDHLRIVLITDEGMPSWSPFPNKHDHDFRWIGSRYSQLTPILDALRKHDGGNVNLPRNPVSIGEVTIYTIWIHGVAGKSDFTYAVHDAAPGYIVFLDGPDAIAGTVTFTDGMPEWSSIGGNIEYDNIDDDAVRSAHEECERALRADLAEQTGVNT